MSKYIYLINEQDAYCWENNNGDYIVAAFDDLELAKDYAKKLKDADDSSDFFIKALELNSDSKLRLLLEIAEEKITEAKEWERVYEDQISFQEEMFKLQDKVLDKSSEI